MSTTTILHRLLLSSLLIAGACGGDDDDNGGGGADGSPEGTADASPDDSDATPSSYAAHLIRPSCAPNDGAAVRILLGESIGGTGCDVDDEASMVELEVWTQEIEAPETFEFGDDAFIGAGRNCPGGEEPCFSFVDGEVHFDSYDEGTGAAGTFVLGTGNEQVTGTFSADWCVPVPAEPCG